MYAIGYKQTFTHHVKIKIYQDRNGREPFTQWLTKLNNKQIELRIKDRLLRIVEFNNFGDCKRIDEEIYEIRFHFGSGYRVYFVYQDEQIIILLCGGDKSSQKSDIKKAKKYLRDYENQ